MIADNPRMLVASSLSHFDDVLAKPIAPSMTKVAM
jgi:hypothetical protein